MFICLYIFCYYGLLVNEYYFVSWICDKHIIHINIGMNILSSSFDVYSNISKYKYHGPHNSAPFAFVVLFWTF